MIGLALAVALLPATPPVCTERTVQQTLVDGGRLTREDVDHGMVVDLVRCGDVTDDGSTDAVFTVASGGSAGDTRFGVLRGGADGAPVKLLLYRQGYSIGIARHSRRAFDVIQPYYNRGDANCCPSSFRVRRYTWNGSRFTVGKARKLKTAPSRFYKR